MNVQARSSSALIAPKLSHFKHPLLKGINHLESASAPIIVIRIKIVSIQVAADDESSFWRAAKKLKMVCFLVEIVEILPTVDLENNSFQDAFKVAKLERATRIDVLDRVD